MFGVRLHAGECVPRLSASSTDLAPAGHSDAGLVAHLDIAVETIKHLRARIQALKFRIGHGVAFLHEPLDAELAAKMNDMRDYLVADSTVVPVEVNLTSNCMLLADNFADAEFCHRNQLAEFHKHSFNVLLATDNDGVCPIPPCKEHDRHSSLAKEFCLGITLGAIGADTWSVHELTTNARLAAFIKAPPVKSPARGQKRKAATAPAGRPVKSTKHEE